MNNKLKILRMTHNLTQKDAAKLLSVSLVTYNRIERGHIKGSVTFWGRVKKVFDVDNIWEVING